MDRQTLLQISMPSAFLRLSIPNMIGMLILAFYYVTDAILVGQFVGQVGLGAISIVMPLTVVLNAAGFFLGGGVSAALARAIGEKDRKTLSQLFGFASFWTLVFTIAVAGLTYGNLDKLLHLLGAQDPQLIHQAFQYAAIIILATPLTNLAITLTMMMRGEGRMRQSSFVLTLGTVINIGLDYLLLGVWHTGVEGAAWATLCAQAIKICAALIIMRKATCSPSMPRPYFPLFKKTTSVGFASLAMQLMSFLQLSVLYRLAGQLGSTTAVAVMGATIQVLNFGFTPLWGLAQGVLPIFGVAHGSGQSHRVWFALHRFIIYLGLVSLATWVVIMVFSDMILALFITDPQVVTSHHHLLRLGLSAFGLYGFLLIMLIYLQGVGKGHLASSILLMRLFAFFIPLAFILPEYLHLRGLFAALAIGDALTCAYCFIIYSLQKPRGLNSLIQQPKTKKIFSKATPEAERMGVR